MKIQTFLVCDDIRNEIGNKHSLIGVYDERIIFNVTPDKKDSWPKTMKIGIFTKINIENDNPHSFIFKMQYNEKEQQIGTGSINKATGTKDNKITIAIIHNNFLFSQPGSIKFTFDFFDEDKNLIQSLSPEFNLKIQELVI